MLTQTWQRTLAWIAQRRDGTVITLIYRQEMLSLLGIPRARSLPRELHAVADQVLGISDQDLCGLR